MRISQTERSRLRMALIVMLAAVALMQLVLVFVHEANWDEYLNLSMIYDYQRGELREVLQTGFVHLLSWVQLVSDNEANQIIAARLLFFGVGIVTSVAIWKIARTLVSTEAAYFTVLSYWAFSYTLVHGVTLRTDPLAASAMMCALWMVVSRPPTVRVVLLAGVLAGLAGFFTIKAIFYVPALIIVFLIRVVGIGSVPRGIWLIGLAGIAALTCFIGLTALHAMTLPDFASPLAFLGRTTDSTLGAQDFSILMGYLPRAFVQNVILALVIIVGLGGLLMRLHHGKDRAAALIGLALLTPLLSVLVYRDTYPYYYPFILAPVMILAGFAWDDISRRYGCKTVMVIATAVSLSAAIVTFKNAQISITTQRLTLSVIHRLFPGRPTYIDGRNMVSSLPKRGLFMSAWGMTDYRRIGRPVMAEIIQTDQPQFVLVNTWLLQMDKISPTQSEALPLGLLAADMATLKDNYVHFWGPIYVPGKTISPDNETMRILLSGTYRLISETPVSIDGKTLEPNTEIYLETRDYLVSALGISRLVLSVVQPRDPPPKVKLFRGF